MWAAFSAGGIHEPLVPGFSLRLSHASQERGVLTLVIVASLAIGIGANSAIFSVIDALLLRLLPYPHPDRLAAHAKLLSTTHLRGSSTNPRLASVCLTASS